MDHLVMRMQPWGAAYTFNEMMGKQHVMERPFVYGSPDVQNLLQTLAASMSKPEARSAVGLVA